MIEAQEENNVLQEGLGQDTYNNEPTDSTEQEDNTQSEEVAQEDPKTANFRELRLSKEKTEKELKEAYKIIKEMRELSKQKQESKEDEPDDYNLGIGEDDFVEGKHVSKLTKKIKQLEKQLKEQGQSYTATTVETRLRNQYKDFDSVVTKDNVESLVKEYPELGNTLKSNADLYSQAVSAYTLIKRMGIYKEDNYGNDRLKAEKNAGKPRPLTSVSPQHGEGPLSRANAFANGLTDELKEQLIKEMNDARSRR